MAHLVGVLAVDLVSESGLSVLSKLRWYNLDRVLIIRQAIVSILLCAAGQGRSPP